METIKLWQIYGHKASPLHGSNQMESEGLLESNLVKNSGLLEEDLKDLEEIDRVRDVRGEYVSWEQAKGEMRTNAVDV